MRNINIFFAAVAGGKSYSELARAYKLTESRIKQIVSNEAKKRAPTLYAELSAMRFAVCRFDDKGQGPTLYEFRLFKDQFLFGDA